MANRDEPRRMDLKEKYLSPESPPDFDGNSLLMTNTRIRVEKEDEPASLRYSLDCSGFLSDTGDYDPIQGHIRSVMSRPSIRRGLLEARRDIGLGGGLGQAVFGQLPVQGIGSGQGQGRGLGQAVFGQLPVQGSGLGQGLGRGQGQGRGLGQAVFGQGQGLGSGQGQVQKGQGYWSGVDNVKVLPNPEGRGYNRQESYSFQESFHHHDHSVDVDRDRSRLESPKPLYDVVESNVLLPGYPVRTPSGDGGRRDLVTPPPPRPKNSCWNCKGDHMITECPEPKDPRRITANRKIFMAARGNNNRTDYSNGGRSARYHEQQTSWNTKPGQLSENLRYAMGLNSQEVPIHVYRMRLYGYPPGWLDSAMQESTSGLKLYGDSITMPVSAFRRDPKINPDSIISYPGFNAPMPLGEIDRWQELGYPRYRPEDSIENMLRKLNSKSRVNEGDGIVSQSAPPQWDSLSGLDRPVLNDGASHGVGRGRHIEVDTLPRHLQPGLGRGRGLGNVRPRSPVFQPRIDRETRPRPRPMRPIVPEEVDERYLPQKPRKRSRDTRPRSPSLLDNRTDFEESRIPRPTVFADRTSPVIMNLPPVPGPSKDPAICDSDDDTGGSTASSSDFLTAPPPKRKKHQKKREEGAGSGDDEVMIIPNKDALNSSYDYDSDCLVIDDDGAKSSPPKSIRVKSGLPLKKKVTKSKPVQEVEDKEYASDSDFQHWDRDESQKVFDKLKPPKRPVSPGSSTGDEEMFMEDSQNEERKCPAKKTNTTIRGPFDEDWEAGSNGSDTDKLIIDEEPLVEPNGPTNEREKTPIADPEYIPPNPHIEAIKDVFLAHIETDADENEKSFTALPTFDKFSQGMPEMVFEQDSPARIGRLDRVLQVLKTRKSAGNIISKDDKQ